MAVRSAGQAAEAVRSAGGDVVLLIPNDLRVLDAHLVRASIAALAIEGAPGRRVNAVAPDAGADPADVAAAAAYLGSATSTTGQVLAVSARSGRVAG